LSFDDPNSPGSDYTGNSKDASLIGGATPTTGKDQTHALSFDGVDDYLKVEYTPALGITGDITLAAWVKRESLNEYRVIAAKSSGWGFWDYDFYFVDGANVLAFWSDKQSPQEVISSASVGDRNWNHVAVTRRGGSVTFYINGVSAGTASVSGKMPDNSYPLLIGTDNLARGKTQFKGQIDDVRLYNQALTGTEVRNLAMPSLWLGRESLVGGPWSAVTGGRSTEAGETKVPITPSSERRFYRLKRN
jgi:Concanavalin A-like lectin/glucanases superfamily